MPRGRRMECMRLLAIALVAAGLVVLAAAAHGSTSPDTRLAIDIEILGAATPAPVRHFTLECGPTGGTIPEADELCRLIAEHPVMLDPPRAMAVCDGMNIPYITVSGVSHG